MKKKLFAVFLALALLLAALAGCGQENGGASRSSGDEEEDQLLEKGWYRVLDEDDELAGYLEVKSSKITVYDETANEEDTLRYEYNAKKDLYAIEDGELFGAGEFTVEKSKKKLTLTADGDKYTLEEIDKEDMPGPGTAKTPGFDDPAEGYIELPTGCYAAYNGSALMGYLKVTRSTLIFYDSDGEATDELRYSYDRDGQCAAADEDGNEIAVFRFTYERGGYYMSGGATAGYLLEPIRESDIPVYDGSNPPAGSSAPGSGLSTVYPGKLTVATSPDFPPFEYYDGNGDIVGIEPEILELICGKLGLELEFVEMDYVGALLAAESGECDLVASGVVITEDRKQIMDFTDSYYTRAEVVVVPEGSGVTLDDLGRQWIGAVDGSAAQLYLSLDYEGATIIVYESYTSVIEALLSGQVDCAVLDRDAARSYVRQNPGLVILDTEYSVEDFAFGVGRGSVALYDAVNRALGELIADGTAMDIVEKYISG